MTKQTQSLLWASAIIATALILSSSDVSGPASFGIIMAMTGAALGATALGTKGRC